MNNDEFRSELKSFIRDHLPPEMSRRTRLRYHPPKSDMLYWTRKLRERGWSVPNWPKHYGGTGWTSAQRHIFDEECFLAGCPPLSPQGVYLVGPIIYSYGTEAQKERFLEPIRSGEHLWAQGFSEPNSGSDLASLQTRAVRSGDEYIVNGQKIWTSEAHYCEWLFLLVRTATGVKPQAGISFLLVDLLSPGVSIRPIVSIDGGHILNEVFLSDVRVPVANLVGEEGKGWTYAKELLGAERAFAAEVSRCKGLLARLREIAAATRIRGRPLIGNEHFAKRLAQLEIESLAHEATLWRVEAEAAADATHLGPQASALKVYGTELVQRIGALMVEALGEQALRSYPESRYLFASEADLDQAAHAPGVVADFLYRRAATIYGGANEVQRNIIAAGLLKARAR